MVNNSSNQLPGINPAGNPPIPPNPIGVDPRHSQIQDQAMTHLRTAHEQRSDEVSREVSSSVEDRTGVKNVAADVGVVPESKPEAFDLKTPLLALMKNEFDRTSIENAIDRIPLDKRQEFLTAIKPILEEAKGDFEKDMIIHVVSKITPGKWSEFLTTVASLLIDIKEEDYRGAIIDYVGKIQPDKWQAFVDVVKLRIESMQGARQKSGFIMSVAQMPPEKWSDLVSKGLPLLKDFKYPDQERSIVQAFAATSPDKWEEFLTVITPSLDDAKSDYERNRIMAALSKLPPAKWQNFLTTLTHLLKHIEREFDRAEIVGQIAKIPPDKWQEFLDVVKSQIADIKDAMCIKEIISTFAAIAPENWKIFQEAVNPLLKNIPDSLSKVIIIGAVSGLQPVEWISFSEAVQPLSESNVRYESTVIGVAVRLLKGITDKRESVAIINEIIPLVKNIEYGDGKSRFILEIAEFEPNKRLAFLVAVKPVLKDMKDPESYNMILGAVRPLLKDVPDLSDQMELINTIKRWLAKSSTSLELYAYEKGGIIKEVVSLLEGVNDVREKLKLLGALTPMVDGVHTNCRIDAIKSVNSLLEKMKDTNEKIALIESVILLVKDTDSDEVKQEMDSVKLLCEGIAATEEKVKLINAIKPHIKDFGSGFMKINEMTFANAFYRAKFIQAVAKLPAEERFEVLETVNLLPKSSLEVPQIQRIELIAGISSDERKGFMDDVIPLLKNVQFVTEQNKIIEALIAVAPDKRKQVVELVSSLSKEMKGYEMSDLIPVLAEIDISASVINLNEIREMFINRVKLEKLRCWINANTEEQIKTVKELQAMTRLIIKPDSLPVDEVVVPPEIGLLKNLKEFSVINTNIHSIPPEIGNLENLEILQLHSNEIQSLPPEIGKLKNLKTLNVSGNQLKTLPNEIGDLQALNALYIVRNNLKTVPKEIGKLSALKALTISNNRLNELPEEIGQLSALEELAISKNQIFELIPQIGQLKNLQKLAMDHNQILELPPEIGMLGNLKTFDFSSNKVVDLPEEIVNLTSNCEIDATNNYISNDVLISLATHQSKVGIEGPAWKMQPQRELPPGTLYVKPKDIEGKPIKVLERLSKTISNMKNNDVLKVIFIGRDQQGVDAGGLGRELISDLFTNLVKQTEYFANVKKDTGAFYPIVAPANKNFTVYKDIGNVMMYCFGMGDRPTGSFFEKKLLESILKFTPEELSAALSELTIDSLKNNIKLSQLESTNHYLQQEFLDKLGIKTLADFQNIEEKAKSAQLTKREMDVLENIIEPLAEKINLFLEPLYTIAQGMYLSKYCPVLFTSAELNGQFTDLSWEYFKQSVYLDPKVKAELIKLDDQVKNQFNASNTTLISKCGITSNKMGEFKKLEGFESRVDLTSQEKELAGKILNLIKQIENQFCSLFDVAKGKQISLNKDRNFTIFDIAAEDPGMVVELVDDRVQGRLSNQLLLDNNLLAFSGVHADKQDWIKEWIRDASPERLVTLVKEMTGSSTLSKASKPLRFIQDNNKQPNLFVWHAHTCFGGLDMNYNSMTNKEAFLQQFTAQIDAIMGLGSEGMTTINRA